MKRAMFLAATAALVLQAMLPSGARAETRNFEVPAGSLSTVLNLFTEQSGVQLVYRSEQTGSARSRGVHGDLSIEAALQQLLAGTGFEPLRDPSGAIAIVPSKPRRVSEARSSPGARAAADSAVAGSVQLEEVVVSARRTEENLQAVPVAVTVIPSAVIEKLNIQDVRAIPQFTPNLAVSAEPGGLTDASIYIRGIGNNENSGLAELGVGIYLDGVYVARPAGSIFNAIDLERIEVLRGPQGTLFGRNTIGGAIQLVSRKPADDMRVELKSGYGRYNDWYGRARLDTGFLGNSPIKASMSYMRHEKDGYFDNRLTPRDGDPGSIASDSFTFAAQGAFDKLTVDYLFDYDIRHGAPPFNQVVVATSDAAGYFGQSAGLGGAPFQIGRTPLSSGLQEGYQGRNESKGRVQGHSLTLDFQLSPALTLKSISAYRSFLQNTIVDLSGNGLLRGVVLDPSTFAPFIADTTLYNGNNRQHQFQRSQELQALGKAGDFSYVLGAYYFYERSTELAPQLLTFALPGGQAGFNLAPVLGDRGDRTSYALFGQASYTPGGGPLELTAGLRSTWDHENMILGGDVRPNLSGHATFDNVSWLFSANYRFTPDVMVYGKVSTGYRGGGINARVGFINVFQPEKALAFEAGIKTELLDHRLRANLAVFRTQYKDLQLQQFVTGTGGVSSFIANAGKVDYSGAELELTARITDGLTLEGSLGYTDPDFKEYMFRDPATNLISNVADEAHMINTSKFNAHAGAIYTLHLDLGELETRVDYSYRGEVYYQVLDRLSAFNANVRSPSDSNVHARIDLTDIQLGGGRLELGVWGDNLTNRRSIVYGIDWGSLGFGTATFREPRSYGVDFKYSH